MCRPVGLYEPRQRVRVGFGYMGHEATYGRLTLTTLILTLTLTLALTLIGHDTTYRRIRASIDRLPLCVCVRGCVRL